jgi:hypothetical protein
MCGIYNIGKGLFSLVGISIFEAYTHIFINAIYVYSFLNKTDLLFRPVDFFFSLALIKGFTSKSRKKLF